MSFVEGDDDALQDVGRHGLDEGDTGDVACCNQLLERWFEPAGTGRSRARRAEPSEHTRGGGTVRTHARVLTYSFAIVAHGAKYDPPSALTPGVRLAKRTEAWGSQQRPRTISLVLLPGCMKTSHGSVCFGGQLPKYAIVVLTR